MMILVGAAAVQATVGRVELEAIHSNPARFEGQTVITCGDAYPGVTTLYLRGWHSGRSRGGLRMDRTLKKQGYVCVRARVVRNSQAEPSSQHNTVSHPTYMPQGWQLEAVRLVSR